MTLSIPELAQYAQAAGWSGDGLVLIVAIALRESGGNPSAIGDIDNPHAGCRSYGLVQINVCPQGTSGGNNRGIPWRENPMTLLDPVTNFRAALELSGGGKNFGPWTTYRSGIAPADTGKVRAALAGGIPAGLPAGSASTSTPTGSASFAGVTAPGDYPIFRMLADWSTWKRVLWIMVGFGLFGAGVLIYKRSALAGIAGGKLGDTLRGENDPTDGPDDGPDDGTAVTAATL